MRSYRARRLSSRVTPSATLGAAPPTPPPLCDAHLACCCYNATNEQPVPLLGDFGTTKPPRIVSFVGNDPDDGDAVYGASDILKVSFDMATDRAKGDPFGPKAWVDDLLWFSLPIGDDYSGEWVDEDAAVLISILAPATTLSTLPEASISCAISTASTCLEGIEAIAPLNVSEAYWRQTLVSPRGDATDIDADGNVGDLRNRAENSPVAGVPLVLQGQLGNLAAPRIVSFHASDPRNTDVVFGAGDILRIELDRAVDRTDVSSSSAGYAAGFWQSRPREAVDRLFGFTSPLGADYNGTWADTSTFIIEIVDASGGGIFVDTTRAYPSTRADAVPLRNRAGCGGTAEAACMLPTAAPPVRLIGDFGVLPPPPRITGVAVIDLDNADAVYSANDTIVVSFDVPTNRAGGDRVGGRAFVDALFNFSSPLGADYGGEWAADGSAFTVTIFDPSNGTVFLEPTRDENGTVVHATTVVTLTADVRTVAGNSPPISVNQSAAVVGSFGENATSAFPRVTRVTGREALRQQLWDLTLYLDRATDQGRTALPSYCGDPLGELSQACALLLFSLEPADALSFPEPDKAIVAARWKDSSTFVMTTTLDVTGSTVASGDTLSFGVDEVQTLQVGTTPYIRTSGLTLNGTQGCQRDLSLTECPRVLPLPNPSPPILANATIDDDDNSDAFLSVGDRLTLHFDRPTDQGRCDPACEGDRLFVHRLFSFSSALASDYSGAWESNSTFVITVTAVDAGFSAPPIGGTLVALRPPNSVLGTFTFGALLPWRTQLGLTALTVGTALAQAGERIPIRTADGLSEYSVPTCAALSFSGCDAVLPAVPVLAGDFGRLSAPRVVSFVANDPDDADEVYGVGDTLTIGIDLATDALVPPRSPSGDAAFVDGLFSFSHSLGADYSGSWTDASTFEITVLDLSGAGAPSMTAGCAPLNASDTEYEPPEENCIYRRLILLATGELEEPPWMPQVLVFFNASAGLRSTIGLSDSTHEPVALGGSLGSRSPPAILSATVDDPDNDDPIYSVGDTITVVFDMETNRGGRLDGSGAPVLGGGASYVDGLFAFSACVGTSGCAPATIGADYSGSWADTSTFVITVVDPTGASPAPRLGVTTVSVLTGDVNVTNKGATSEGCAASATLTGSFGSERPPQLVAFTVDDEDNGDLVYGYCDVLAFRFDMGTDRAGRDDIDVYDLLYFANPPTVGGVAECDVLIGGECPVYDLTNGLSYTTAWLDGGRTYEVRLQCPAPAGTPQAAQANFYAGAPAPTRLVGNNSATLQAYSLKVAQLRLGTTRVRLRTDVRNAARSMGQSTLTGEFGSLDQPRIVSYVASNRENADDIYGESDLLTISFDKPTDMAGGARYGLKNYVDGLFAFSEGDPADDYSGEWRDDSTFVVRLIDPIDVVPSVADDVPFSTRSANMRISTAGGVGRTGALIQNRGVSADRIANPDASQEVSGNFGRVATPQLASFEAADQDHGDEVLSEGDTLTLAFDVATDRGGATLQYYPSDPTNAVGRADVDRLFVFSDELGADYSGLWRDASTLVVTVTNASGTGATLGSTLARVRDTYGGVVRNSYGNAPASSGTAVLSGSFGSFAAPSITSVVLEDVDNADTVYGEGDTITITFDRATDRGGPSAATKGAEAFVDALFQFSAALGARYSGEWVDASSFVVQLVNTSNEEMTSDGVSLQPVRVTPRGATQPIRTVSRLSAPAMAQSPLLTTAGAGVGNALPPALVGFVASDPDSGDATFSVGDTLTITFDGRTNLGAHAGGQAYVDSLFSIQPSLGADYNGSWADGSVFVISVRQASNALAVYSGQFQTTPVSLSDTEIVCASFDRGAFADFADVDREMVVALNGVDFVRTQQTYKYYTQPYNITRMAPVTGGTAHGGTMITLYGLGFHEFEGRQTPRFARCRWTDSRTTDDTIAVHLSGTQLRCPTPPKPDTATHELFVSLNGADFDPTSFSFGFYSLDPQRSRRVSLRVNVPIDSVQPGSAGREAFQLGLRTDLADVLTASIGAPVAADRLELIRIVDDDGGGSGSAAGRRLDGGGGVTAIIELLPVSSAQEPSVLLIGERIIALVTDPTSGLYAPGRAWSSLIDPGVTPTVSLGFREFPVFHTLSVQGGPIAGGTVVDLQGAALDAFNGSVRCRWGTSDAAQVTPSFFSATRITCTTSPLPSGPKRLYVSLNGIAPFEDSGLDFLYYTEPAASDIYSIHPSGGPNEGGTLVTVSASGLDALGPYRPPADGAARCRWGEWFDNDASFRETVAVLVDAAQLVCLSPPRAGAQTDQLSIAINGQQFLRTSLALQFYEQPGRLALISGLLKGPSSGGTTWTMWDERATLAGFDNTAAKLRYCRWGGADVTVAATPGVGANASAEITCSAADKGGDFAGLVRVYISLNGVDFSDTGLSFTYYRTPRITSYSPHGGPVECTVAAANFDGSSFAATSSATPPLLFPGDVSPGEWKTSAPPKTACNLQRNWQAASAPAVIKAVAAGMTAGYGPGDTISVIFESPTGPGLESMQSSSVYHLQPYPSPPSPLPPPQAPPVQPGETYVGPLVAKAYVDSIVAFAASAAIVSPPAPPASVARPVCTSLTDQTSCDAAAPWCGWAISQLRCVECVAGSVDPGVAVGDPVSLGTDYSGEWVNEWTFVITVLDAACASRALDVIDVMVNVSLALGLPTRTPLQGISKYGFDNQYCMTANLFCYKPYFWDGYDDGNLDAYALADTPVALCERAAAVVPSRAADCAFARFMHVPAVTTDVTMTTLGLIPVLGATAVSLRDGIRLRNSGGTSPPTPASQSTVLQGSFGSFDPPRIVSVLASDGDNSAQGFSDGDTIRIRYDVPLSVRYRNWQGGLTADPSLSGVVGVSGGRALVDALFVFSGKLGEAYGGEWEDELTFKVTVHDTRASYGVAIGSTTVTTKRCAVLTAAFCGDITNAARTSDPSVDVALLGGDFGVVGAPRLHRFAVADPDEGDLVYGPGDELTLEFDMATNRALDVGGRDYVGSLFVFSWDGATQRSPALPSRVGDDFSAAWSDGSTFVLTLTSSASPAWPVQLGLSVRVEGDVRTPVLNAPPSSSSAVLPQPRPPAIVSFVASDADNADAALGAADTLTISFDRLARPQAAACSPVAVWPCASSGGMAFVNSLFEFGHPLGASYRGEWTSGFRFTITLDDPTGGSLRLGGTNATAHHWVLPGFAQYTVGDATRYSGGVAGPPIAGASAISYTTAPLTGSFGFGANRAPAVLHYGTRAFSRDAAAAGSQLTTLASGVQVVRPRRMAGAEALLVFDMDTDRAGASLGATLGRAALDAFLRFSTPLGGDYTGAWLTADTLHVVVTDAGPLNLTSAAPDVAPAGWLCELAVYASGDGCDCGCGVWDPDCDVAGIVGAWGCAAGEACSPPGVCSGVPAAISLAGGTTGVRSAAGLSAPTTATAPDPYPGTIPNLLTARASDPDNGDSVLSAGDLITLTFDTPTDYAGGPVRGNRSLVDDIFRFSTDIAAEYSGEWHNATVFVVTLLDVSGSRVSLGSLHASLRQDGIDADGDGVAGDINSAVSGVLSTSAERLASLLRRVPLSGSFGAKDLEPLRGMEVAASGATVPGITRFAFQDTEGVSLHPTWSVGDSLVVGFGELTNVKAGWPTAGGKDFVDALFAFSAPLGEDYSGEWRSASTFVVTAIDVAEGSPALGLSSARVLADVKAAAGAGPSANQNTSASQLLGGDFGSVATPAATAFVARDPDNSERGYGPGDTLSLSFSLPTNRDSSSPSRAYVDSLFAFSPQFGDDYSGAWADDSTFLITVLAVGTNAPELGEAVASVRGVVRDAARQRPPATNSSVVLGGNYGRTDAPRLVSFVADDPTDRDSVYGPGDTLTLSFDMATDRGGRNESSMDRSQIDSLFAFSAPLGANYSGAWHDDSTFAVTVINGSTTPPVVGVSDVRLTNTSNIRNRAATSTPRQGVPVELTGDFGSSAPRLAAFTARGAGGDETVYGEGDVFTILFDKATDRAGVRGGRTYVESLFSFSHDIGRDFSGAWLDSSMFTVPASPLRTLLSSPPWPLLSPPSPFPALALPTPSHSAPLQPTPNLHLHLTLRTHGPSSVPSCALSPAPPPPQPSPHPAPQPPPQPPPLPQSQLTHTLHSRLPR